MNLKQYCYEFYTLQWDNHFKNIICLGAKEQVMLLICMRFGDYGWLDCGHVGELWDGIVIDKIIFFLSFFPLFFNLYCKRFVFRCVLKLHIFLEKRSLGVKSYLDEGFNYFLRLFQPRNHLAKLLVILTLHSLMKLRLCFEILYLEFCVRCEIL